MTVIKSQIKWMCKTLLINEKHKRIVMAFDIIENNEIKLIQIEKVQSEIVQFLKRANL